MAGCQDAKQCTGVTVAGPKAPGCQDNSPEVARSLARTRGRALVHSKRWRQTETDSLQPRSEVLKCEILGKGARHALKCGKSGRRGSSLWSSLCFTGCIV